jgi:hypothetical protein
MGLAAWSNLRSEGRVLAKNAASEETALFLILHSGQGLRVGPAWEFGPRSCTARHNLERCAGAVNRLHVVRKDRVLASARLAETIPKSSHSASTATP